MTLTRRSKREDRRTMCKDEITDATTATRPTFPIQRYTLT